MARLGPWRREFSAPLSALQSELNKLFDEYWTPTRYPAGQPSPTDLDPASWSPAIDLIETPDAYVLTADVPGVDPGSIDLSLTGNTLNLRGLKPAEDAHEPTIAVLERRSGPFFRQVTLPGEVDFEATQAEARLGVLRIRLPKRQSAKPRTIPVQSA